MELVLEKLQKDKKKKPQTTRDEMIDMFQKSWNETCAQVNNENVFNDTHREKLVLTEFSTNSVHGWLLLTFFIYLHNQLSYFNSIIINMSEKCDSSNRQ